MTISALLWILGAYLAGSIPFGLLIGLFTGKGDIRKIGSGNIGATNMMRAGGKKLAALTLVLDGLKGYIPVSIMVGYAPAYVSSRLAAMNCIGDCSSSVWHESHLIITSIFCAAILGHIFPVWLKFKGGKGVATFLGGLFGLNWLAGVLFILVWLGLFGLKRISALSAIAATFLSPFAVFVFTQNTSFTIATCIMSLIVIARHKDNVKRMMHGGELAFQAPASSPQQPQTNVNHEQE